jgi:hypothetical protein
MRLISVFFFLSSASATASVVFESALTSWVSFFFSAVASSFFFGELYSFLKSFVGDPLSLFVWLKESKISLMLNPASVISS